ncbi:MAG TPA: hypothetical protein VFC01_19895 [Mycobacterium sp.]|jgi:hypothetical protein|nr:hypothetical protein [Mycobacterium sp.]
MMWKIFAAVCASGLIIAGAAALAFAPADSGPSLSNSTTTPTTTTTSATMPNSPGYMGGY